LIGNFLCGHGYFSSPKILSAFNCKLMKCYP
jgi:hypothetical protein